MKPMQQFALLLLMLTCAGCAHTTRKVAAGLYVPFRCIQKVSWTRPCATVSANLVKCDGVMVTTSCVSPRKSEGQLDRTKLRQE